MESFIVIDFETANFKRSSICSIGIAIVENGEIVRSFQRLVKPTPNYYEEINIGIHGLTERDTNKCDTFDKVWPGVYEEIKGYPLISHNVSFDMSALRYTLDQYEIPYPDIKYYCTLELSKLTFLGLINYRLPTIVNHLGFNIGKHHDAEYDAIAAARLMIAIMRSHDAKTFYELEKNTGVTAGGVYATHRTTHIYNKLNLDIASEDDNLINEKHPFYGKRVVITGRFSGMSKQEALQKVVNVGGIATNSVTKQTDYLIVASFDFMNESSDYESDKIKKAKELISKGQVIEVISDHDFYKMTHFDSLKFEITLQRIMEDSRNFLATAKYNSLSNSLICYSSHHNNDLWNALTIYQKGSYCNGTPVVDDDDIGLADYVVVSNSDVDLLAIGCKSQRLQVIERKININREDKTIIVMDESTFNQYMNNREQMISNHVIN